MKTLLSVVVLSSAVFGMTAEAAAPKYTLKSKEVIGGYERVESSCTESETNRPCIEVTVKKVGSKLMIVTDYTEYREASVSLIESNGKLVFSWENSIPDDCQDPGCWDLLSVSGVVYPKKVGRKYVPAIKLYVKKDYVAPESEEDPVGEVTETETFTKRVN